jgi:hypothetical protein
MQVRMNLPALDYNGLFSMKIHIIDLTIDVVLYKMFMRLRMEACSRDHVVTAMEPALVST